MKNFIINNCQKYKVFNNNSVLIITENINDSDDSSAVKISALDSDFFEFFIRQNEEEKVFVYQAEDASKALLGFADFFKIIFAAGGIVKNAKNELLVIFRNGFWDLPKGKVEKNERIDKAAIREVSEETGLTDITLVKQVTTTYHIYCLKDGTKVFKPTFWYEMRSLVENGLIPQVEEGITEVKWMSLEILGNIKKQTFKSLLPLFNSIFD